jgi:hypothetical protein
MGLMRPVLCFDNLLAEIEGRLTPRERAVCAGELCPSVTTAAGLRTAAVTV